MRAWRVTHHGEPSEVLSLADVAVPDPGPDELRIRVAAAAIGMPDVFMCRGTYAFSPTMPFTPGQEACGIVTAAGADTEHAVGTRVMGVTRFPEGHGGFAEEALLRVQHGIRGPGRHDRRGRGRAPDRMVDCLGRAGSTGAARRR